MDYLTVYAFSTENWKRPKDEVDGIMHLLEQYLHECIDTMEKDGNRLHFLGDLSVLTPELRELIDETNNDGNMTRQVVQINLPCLVLFGKEPHIRPP